jgi:hypothetical protein
MTDRQVAHATFTLERRYPVPPSRVFGAWVDPVAKARWFSTGDSHQLDFRVGGREVARGHAPAGRRWRSPRHTRTSCRGGESSTPPRWPRTTRPRRYRSRRSSSSRTAKVPG